MAGKFTAKPSKDGLSYTLDSPSALPKASTFLWNSKLMLQVSARGFVQNKYLGVEPDKYSFAPNIEANTFFQPEMPYYAHHPGRFIYVKDHDSGALSSLPYEPVRAQADKFLFRAGQTNVTWEIEQDGLAFQMTLQTPADDVVEIWSLSVKNISGCARKFSLFPAFTIGFMSWMNQSARYDVARQAIIASCVFPYQKLNDFPKNSQKLPHTVFMADRIPDGFETARERFEGEGGIQNPDGIREGLSRRPALYETPAAVMQFDLNLMPGANEDFRFLFGPAKDDAHIDTLRDAYLTTQIETGDMEARLATARECLEITTPDSELDNFVNIWLPRQLLMHGDLNRLTLDPQTRNYLQDNMGMSYLAPAKMRTAILRTLSQQNADGSLPDGILLQDQSELNFINQVPHRDHNVWLPVCLEAYLNETNDWSMLEEIIDGETVSSRITRAVNWLINNRDSRGLSFIAQGDWCDPMNMVGPKGKGVSGWLTIATAHAAKLWSAMLTQSGNDGLSQEIGAAYKSLKSDIQTQLWDGDWFIRGISDDGVRFGCASDQEGRLFINPQSWAMMAEVADADQKEKMLSAIERELKTPYGVALLAPAFTRLHKHIGRVTQKFPGSAENGSVYNHGAIFYIYALYQLGRSDLAFYHLKAMLPSGSQDDLLRRGQLPVFIPNYYRGAYHQFPEAAGRSSHMFNTGTVSWFYRCIIEGLVGLTGCREGLRIAPQLPKDWHGFTAKRKFRGAEIHLNVTRGDSEVILVDGEALDTPLLRNVKPGVSYRIDMQI